MLPPRAEFGVMPAGKEYETQTDLNGYTYQEVNGILQAHRRRLFFNTPGVVGGSGMPWLIIDSRSTGFEFGIKTYTRGFADEDFIRRFDGQLPNTIPVNIPFILERMGTPRASYTELTLVQAESAVKSGNEQRVLRRYIAATLVA